MKKKSIVFVMLLATVIFASCSRGDDYMISQSVFIEDETNPGLPVYSEWGYNSFGAYWDRAAFVSERYNVPTKIVVENDSCYWLFNGRLNGNQYTKHLIMSLCEKISLMVISVFIFYFFNKLKGDETEK